MNLAPSEEGEGWENCKEEDEEPKYNEVIDESLKRKLPIERMEEKEEGESPRFMQQSMIMS